jgi:hypothetical protein
MPQSHKTCSYLRHIYININSYLKFIFDHFLEQLKTKTIMFLINIACLFFFNQYFTNETLNERSLKLWKSSLH